MKLKDWVEQNGLRTVFVSRKLEINQQNLYDVMNGKTMPSLPLAIRIVEYTKGQVSYQDLVTRTHYRERMSKELKEKYTALSESKELAAPVLSDSTT